MEKQALIAYYLEYPGEGCRRLRFMMLDAVRGDAPTTVKTTESGNTRTQSVKADMTRIQRVASPIHDLFVWNAYCRYGCGSTGSPFSWTSK